MTFVVKFSQITFELFELTHAFPTILHKLVLTSKMFRAALSVFGQQIVVTSSPERWAKAAALRGTYVSSPYFRTLLKTCFHSHRQRVTGR